MLSLEFVRVDDETSLLLRAATAQAEGGGVVGAAPSEVSCAVVGAYAEFCPVTSEPSVGTF